MTATVHFTLSRVQARADTGATLPVMDSVTLGSDTKSASASSALSDLTGSLGQVWTVAVKDGPVFVTFGAGTPVAVSDAGRMLPPGIYDFAVTTAAEKVAFKDA